MKNRWKIKILIEKKLKINKKDRKMKVNWWKIE